MTSKLSTIDRLDKFCFVRGTTEIRHELWKAIGSVTCVTADRSQSPIEALRSTARLLVKDFAGKHNCEKCKDKGDCNLEVLFSSDDEVGIAEDVLNIFLHETMMVAMVVDKFPKEYDHFMKATLVKSELLTKKVKEELVIGGLTIANSN